MENVQILDGLNTMGKHLSLCVSEMHYGMVSWDQWRTLIHD